MVRRDTLETPSDNEGGRRAIPHPAQPVEIWLRRVSIVTLVSGAIVYGVVVSVYLPSRAAALSASVMKGHAVRGIAIPESLPFGGAMMLSIRAEPVQIITLPGLPKPPSMKLPACFV